MKSVSAPAPTQRRALILLLLFGAFLGWATLFRGYDQPAAFFWDENYHIASAQKYLNRVFFQEPHPPLGKLLLAAGEQLVDANDKDDSFISTNHASSPPPGFSFTGYRLLPALLAAFSVPLFGLLAWQLTRSPVVAAVCMAAFGLDNALIVHLRSAMLEGPQIFFLITAAIAALANTPVLAGAAAGLAIATKVNSAPAAAIIAISLMSRVGVKGTARFAIAAILTWVCVWQIHFSLGQRVLSDTYKAPEHYLQSIKDGKAGDITLFPTALSEALAFFADYQDGVPSLNMCKAEENGSYPLLWPLGAQSINYRWERKDGQTSYLYLQINPAVWFFSLAGALWAFRNWSLKPLSVSAATALALLYAAGVVLPLLYDRVFYLYHFFIPLLCGILAGGLALAQLEQRFKTRVWGFSALVALTFLATFRFFAPLTYAHPITDAQLEQRAWSSLWNLRCAGCSATYPIARPIPNEQSIVISGQKALAVSQGWGVTRMGVTDEGAPLRVDGVLFQHGIGTHAKGEISVAIPSWATVFSASVGVPDTYRGKLSSVEFVVEADGKELWHSPIIRAGSAAVPFAVAVKGYQRLVLKILDAGDGNTDDHGAWLEPSLK